ncbi:hypothetical protein HU200_041880 [Digitaria exilis]|uniref:Uncharacterized protein n=1 Tax=Digitaria exilis TaxID=1010633 RepID=A0A835EFC7_9POAL|nr:hypothetical protein HU200_041880 [Digitaria exilis]
MPMKRSPKDVFTRFSVTTFSSVLDALTPDAKKAIDKYGLGSLLMFEKCYVPNKFAKWVAHRVNYRSGDIFSDGKVISLSKQSVHQVLHLPISEKPFPTDFSVGKSSLLAKFHKHYVPSVSFFANKLILHEEMSDEDTFICFVLVAMSCFLCPNSSLVPCYKYFGIFEDINNVKELDWCGYILD